MGACAEVFLAAFLHRSSRCMARVYVKADALEARAVLQAHLDESDDDDFAEIM